MTDSLNAPAGVPIVSLASASPRRSLLLDQIGIVHRVRPAPVDETALPNEMPRNYVLRRAEHKARRAWLHDASLPVLAADTSVVLDGAIHGKPADRADALRMLGRLSGRVHEVLTAVALATHVGIDVRLSTSKVSMRSIGVAEREAYWSSGEPVGKAGAYAIQGIGARFIRRLEGSYSGVMGLPLFETCELLRAHSIVE